MPKSITLADIARKSKCSVSTVSLVLRDKPGIPDETRQRVLKAARALGYRAKNRRVSQPAAGSQPGRLHNVGLILKSEPGIVPQANPFYSYVLAGIEEACRREKANLLLATMPVDDNNIPLDMPRLLSEDGVDGLLLVGAFVDETLLHVLHAAPLPVVLVDAYSKSNEYDSVESDNLRGAYEAVTYLIDHGHRHIALIAGRADAYPSVRERRAGYLQALRDHGVAETYIADCPLRVDCAFEATTALLQAHPQITALFGSNDEVSISAMRAAQALGRRLPEDLSVIGFDDIDLAQHVSPALTTMHVDKVAMGRLAVQLLQNRLQYPGTECVTSVLRPRLIERASVATLGTA